MPYCGHWSVEYHARPGPTHHSAYLRAHFGLVAMYRTLLARRLPGTETTPPQPCIGILHKLAVFIVHTVEPQFVTAVQFHHPGHHTFLAFNTSHNTHVRGKATTIFPQPQAP